LTLPFLSTDPFATFDEVNYRYYDRLKDLFKFDLNNPLCCKARAEPKESILYFQHFGIEMLRAPLMGFGESSAQKTAQELFSNLKAGDKVAITSRFPDNGAQEYVKQFKRLEIEGRVVSGQSLS
jgi:hypothetical protein